MADIIQLLPDSVANQIAAGEVVQRPASVVKELMENAIDAGAKKIQVILKNAGKGFIQVIDDGKGMSPRDSRMAFERHATSKISCAQDLFNIRTMGFRGEALASIASVAEVELRTKRAEDELGTYLLVADSELKNQENVNCPQGTNMLVKNLFYTIPARRKFLKSDATELRNITTEFLRVALTTPDISYTLINNGNEIYNLPASGLRQRIVNAFGKAINAKLLPVNCETGIISINGFVCIPQHARKTYGEQYFFVNHRFMKHNFFHKAITEAYTGLISADMIPSYFLYFTVDPSIIDVNIHPTKTEIKFQDEGAIFQIILASVKEALGKFNVTPTIDFDTDDKVEFTLPDSPILPKIPKVSYNPNYNPFNYSTSITKEDSDFEGVHRNEHTSAASASRHREQVPANWDALFAGLEEKTEEIQTEIPEMTEEQEEHESIISFLQMKGRFIITPVHSGLMFIDQKRAHERVLYERYLETLSDHPICGQKSLFPETLELSAEDFILVKEIMDDLNSLGFELGEFGKNCYAIYATPADLPTSHGKEVLISLLEHYKNTEGSIRDKMRERIALSLAKAASLNYNTPLDKQEMRDLFDNLFACKHPNYTADGKTIIHILKNEDVIQWFK